MANDAERGEQRRVIRDVDLAAVRDLLATPPRATVAFVRNGAIDCLPVRARCDGDSHSFGIAPEAAACLDGAEVVLLIDEGPWWFELRGVSVRGIAAAAAAPAGGDELAWFRVAPTRFLAWDYGALREE